MFIVVFIYFRLRSSTWSVHTLGRPLVFKRWVSCFSCPFVFTILLLLLFFNPSHHPKGEERDMCKQTFSQLEKPYADAYTRVNHVWQGFCTCMHNIQSLDRKGTIHIGVYAEVLLDCKEYQYVVPAVQVFFQCEAQLSLCPGCMHENLTVELYGLTWKPLQRPFTELTLPALLTLEVGCECKIYLSACGRNTIVGSRQSRKRKSTTLK